MSTPLLTQTHQTSGRKWSPLHLGLSPLVDRNHHRLYYCLDEHQFVELLLHFFLIPLKRNSLPFAHLIELCVTWKYAVKSQLSIVSTSSLCTESPMEFWNSRAQRNLVVCVIARKIALFPNPQDLPLPRPPSDSNTPEPLLSIQSTFTKWSIILLWW